MRPQQIKNHGGNHAFQGVKWAEPQSHAAAKGTEAGHEECPFEPQKMGCLVLKLILLGS